MRNKENVVRLLVFLMAISFIAGCTMFGPPLLIFQSDAVGIETSVLQAFNNREATLSETEAMRSKICAWQTEHNKMAQNGASLIVLTENFEKLKAEITKDLAAAKKKSEEVNNAD